MLDARGSTRGEEDGDRIELVGVGRDPVPAEPGCGDVLNFSLLASGDRLKGMAIRKARPGLHLYEGDLYTSAGHKVDLPVTQAEVAMEDGPTVRLEVLSGQSFPSVAQLLPPHSSQAIRSNTGCGAGSGAGTPRPIASAISRICAIIS